MVSIVLDLCWNVLPILQFVLHFFSTYEQKFVMGNEPNAPHFEILSENGVDELCLFVLNCASF